jgi:peptide/nickel transport system permease protein
MPFLPGRNEAGGFERGWLLDRIWHLAAPVICLSYGSFAFLSKLSRGAVLENIRADYVRTARAKGVGEKDVLYRHVLTNSLIPLITVGAHILPALITGSVVVERIFSLPGMGNLTIEAIEMRDRELFLSTTLVAGLLGLLGYLLADILYAVADPRVSYE